MTGPTVGVVVPTRDRTRLLRETLAGIAAQDWPGRIETVVVHDGTPPDRSVEVGGDRPVRVVANTRTPGLAGARNTGILALGTDLVAFCDDDDVWLPAKLTHQVARASRPDRPELTSCAITVVYERRRSVRLAGADRVTYEQLTRSRMSMVHSSTFLFERAALVDSDRIGLVDEQAPGSQNEDWDLLLRASARRPVAHVDEPLVDVRWGATSDFARAWESKVASCHWMLERHPSIAADRRARARVYGQIAFGEAAQGHRGDAVRWAGRTLRADPLQWRAVPALAVAGRVTRAESVMDVLHRLGRGV